MASSVPDRTRRAATPRGRTPLVVGVVAGVAAAFFVAPLIGLLARAPWSDLWTDLVSRSSRDALRLSLVCSVAAMVLALAFGIPLAWVLARSRFPGRSLLRALVLVPMVVPPVVGGVALLYAFGRNGLLGQWLYDAFGIQLTFHTTGAVLAETFVAMPFFVITVEAGFRSLEARYEEVASTLGASRWTTFRRVTLPMLAPSLLAGSALAWARALGEFGATVTFAGNIQGRTQTMPLAVYLELETNPGGAIALSLVLLAISIGVLVLLRDRWFRLAR